jgi:hypothetical protein
MSVFDLFKRDQPVELKDNSEFFDMSLDTLLSLLANQASVDKIYEPEFEPDGGWDKWCSWAAKQGKIARIIRSLAKNAMSFDFAGGDEKALELVRQMARRTHLKTVLILTFKDWLVYGRCFLEPVWEIKRTGSRKGNELIKVKRVAPQTITVFRDNDREIQDLKEYLKNTEYADYATELKIGTGDNVIGFVQFWDKRHEDKAIFFKPEELIFIPRYSDHDSPDGISLLRENYTIVMNKLGMEKSQAIMAKRYIDPKLKFIIPDKWWGKRKKIIETIKQGLKAGLDLFLPEDMDVDILEPKGNPIAVIKAQQHVEDQFIAAMGFADSFTESTSSNRSVGEVQLQFFERDIRPERALFAEILEDRLIKPYIEAKLGKVDPPHFQFEDLTPEDQLEKARIMVPLVQYMTSGQLKKFFEDLGYPVPEEEEEDFSKKLRAIDLATQKGVPKPVLGTSVMVREEFAEEIRRLRNELARALGY